MNTAWKLTQGMIQYSWMCYAAASGLPPVEHYECVKQVTSTTAVPNFCSFGYKLEMSCCTNWRRVTFAERRFIFKNIVVTFQHCIWCLLSNTLLCNHLVRRAEMVVQKKLIMCCDKVYILFSRNTRNQLLFWCFMFSFYLKAEKCLKIINVTAVIY